MNARLAQALWWIVLLAAVVTYVWIAMILPDRVPSHFDGTGRVDAWSSKRTELIFWPAMVLLTMIGMPAIGRLATRGDGTYLNLPHKDYWLAPQHRAQFQRMFTADMLVFAALTGALMIAMMAVTAYVAVAELDGAPWWWFATLIGAYVVLMVWWSVAMLRRYRPPED